MDGVLLSARLVLAVIFGVAGLAKLLDRPGSREGLIGFGVPARLARPLALLLPIAELGVAVALLPSSTGWWAAVAALVLLAAFVAAIGLNLARGRRPDCHCFGQLYSKPVGVETLVRNAVLAVFAAVVLWAGPGNSGASAVAWLGDLSIAERAGLLIGVLVLSLLGVLAWLQVQMLRQQGRLLLRLDAVEARLDGRFVGNGPLHQIDAHAHGANGHHHASVVSEQGLPVGAPAPDVSLSDLDGQSWTVDHLTEAGTPSLLLFVDPQCGACNSLLPDVGQWQRECGDALTVALVSRGTAAENRLKVTEHGVGPVLLQEDFEVANAFEVPGTPAAVLITAGGAIGSPLAVGAEAIRELATRLVSGEPVVPVNGVAEHADAPPEYGQEIGALAPAFELPDLDGIKLSSEDLRGQRTLLLFWNPGCGFCQRMLPDLKVWEESPPPRAPKLVLISAGSAHQARELGLRAPILLDGTGATAQAYGANGTPMAVVVDAEGRIASKLAGGAPGCLALAGFRRSLQPA